MTIGILGGSFNPVHIGHLMLASYMQQFGGFDEVWLTLSPLNPLKAGSDELIPDLMRLKMLEIATGTSNGLNVCDYELTMPKPSYTINTLRYLEKRYPRHTFKLIIGSDNWKIFDQWKDHESILSDFGVVVYPRPGYPVGTIYEDGVDVINAPMADVSSTFLRKAIARGKDMTYFLPNGVFDYIKQNKLYGAKS
ncbi:nicotinate (nicotinamide) nucleotide adenylyltransferase [uncultured Duncaniella sp.]|uniref:nicotinate (nicotinamide) nucleotide adenylyltransferase n=1 Tax=uncultured Duncaniella sp. TaxID=2768039 RepID=UPI0027302CAE|nr:nicotinate (nicotinamide) nucleotide adenylyltransferase [uncultured Duncaniella sp.]